MTEKQLKQAVAKWQAGKLTGAHVEIACSCYLAAATRRVRAILAEIDAQKRKAA